MDKWDPKVIDAFMTRRDVAELLRLTPRQLRGHMDELYADGFPKPALGFGQNARWDPLAIRAWRERKSNPVALLAAITSFDHDADVLDRRAESLAKGKVH